MMEDVSTELFDLFSQMSDPVACYRPDGTIAFANDAACLAMSRPRAEIVGTSIWAMYPQALGDPFHAAFQAVLASGAPQVVENYYAHLRRWYTSSLYRAGELVVVVTRDITGERAAVERLSVLAQVSQLFTEPDPATRFEAMARLVSERLRDICSIRLLAEGGPRFDAPVATWDPDPAVREELAKIPSAPSESDVSAKILHDMQTVLIANSAPEEVTAQLAPAGQRERVADLRIHCAMLVPIRASGRVIGLLSLARRRGGTEAPFTADDQTLAEELAARLGPIILLWQSMKDLETSRAQLTALVADLRAAVTARDEFLSVASHELRTPLAALDLQMTTLSRDLAKPAPVEAVIAKAARATRQIARLSSLVDRLLDVTRLGEQTVSLDRTPVDLAELLHETVDRLADEAAKARTPLQLEVHGPIAGSWDRFRLEQLFTNLMTNAIKYGAAHPVTITASVTETGVRVVVRDEGIGIPAGDLARIFERFERAVSSDHFSGLGLGLYIAQKIAHAHGGRITVQSEVGAGSAFTVDLPSC